MSAPPNEHDRRFTPFNFSTVAPFDSLAAALAQLPLLHVSEPLSECFGFADEQVPTHAPAPHEQAEMLRVICDAAHEAEWLHAPDAPSPSRPAPPCPSSTDWISLFDTQLTAALATEQKAIPRVHKSLPKRPTPKRPRSAPNPIVVSSDSEQRPAQPPTPRPASPPPRPAPSPHDVHQRELRMQQLSKDVDLDDRREFASYLQKLLRRVDALRQAGLPANHAVLKLTADPAQISDLRQKVVLAVSQNCIPHLPPLLLQQFVAALDARIDHAALACANDAPPGLQNETQRVEECKAPLAEAVLGMQAAQVVLHIVAAPNSPRFLLVEERLESIVSLLRTVCTNLVYPAFDPIYQSTKSNAAQRTKTQQARGARKQRTSDAGLPKLARRRAAGKKDEALHDACCSLLNTLSTLFRKEQHLPDSVVSHCASLCIQSFSVTGIERMHLQAMKTTCSIFSSYRAHRLSIMDEVREAVSVIPANRRHLRCFQIAGAGGEVRVTSALLAQLLCIASTDEEDTDSKPGSKSDADTNSLWAMLRQKRHDRAVKMAGHVLEPLLNRWNSEREPEYRMAFQALFEDILKLYGQPEWPSAELILQTLSVAVIQKMRTTEEKSVLLKSSSFDILGLLAAKMCEFYGEQVLREQVGSTYAKERNEALEEERETLLTFLGSQPSLQLSAAKCFYEALFVADDVSVAINHQEATKRIAINAQQVQEGEEVIDGQDADVESKEDIYSRIEKDALHRMERVSNRLSRREQVDAGKALQASRKVGMSRSFARGFRRIIDAILDGTRDTAPTVRTKSIKALAVIDESCPSLFTALPFLFKSIEESCRDISALARDAALDLLSRFLEREAATPSEDRKAVNGFVDHKQEDSLVKWVLSIVEKRLLDTSVSVRKRAVTIMGTEMLRTMKRADASREGEMRAIGKSDRTRLYEERIVRICIGVIARMDDPEGSVRDAAERTVRLGLFGFDMSQRTASTSSFSNDAVCTISERLINVFSKLRSMAHASFLSRLVDSQIRARHQPLLESIVSTVVDQFHEYEAKIATTSQGRSLRELEPSELNEVKGFTAYRVACSSVICAFAGLDAALVTPHCRALAPTLKGVGMGSSSESELMCVQRVLKILELGLGKLRDADVSFLEEVMHDVEIIMCQSPVTALEEPSVRCLCVITRIAGTSAATELVTGAATTFRSYLEQFKDELGDYCRKEMPPRPTGLERNARGAMVRLGLLTRYADFEQSFIEQVYDTLELICDAVCVQNARDTLANAAIRALSHLLIRHRSMLARGTELFLYILNLTKNCDNPVRQSVVGADAHRHLTFAESVQLCVFHGFNELLRDEEERNSAVKQNDTQNGLGEGKKESSSKRSDVTHEDGKRLPDESNEVTTLAKPVLAAEEDAEAGFLALSAQSMIPVVQAAVQSTSLQVRRIVANILGLIVRQGLVLPATVVPTLFCLLLDQDTRCRDCSFRVVLFLSDRYSDMLASAMLRSLRLCFEPSFYAKYVAMPILHNEIESTKDAYADKVGRLKRGAVTRASTAEEICDLCIDGRNGQSLLSAAIMSLRRDQRRGVMESIMREFDPRASTKVASHETNGHSARVEQNETGQYTPMSIQVGNNGERAVEMDVEKPKAVPENGENGDNNDGDEDEDEDEDVGDLAGQELELVVSDKLCPLPVLCFLAVTIATVDYTNGAGLGGSLTQGGGTAAADTKMKHAREDVTELIGIATRIISNSGQATLRVVKQLRKKALPCIETKLKVALCASRMYILLRLKYHLKVERWRAGAEMDGSKEEGEIAGATVKMGQLSLGEVPLELGAMQGGEEKLSQVADAQFEMFEKLMREDGIEESEVGMGGSGKRGGRLGWSVRRKGGMGRLGNGKRMRRKSGGGGGEMGNVRRGRVQRRASASRASKRLRYEEGEEEEEDGGSDFDPNKG